MFNDEVYQTLGKLCPVRICACSDIAQRFRQHLHYILKSTLQLEMLAAPRNKPTYMRIMSGRADIQVDSGAGSGKRMPLCKL